MKTAIAVLHLKVRDAKSVYSLGVRVSNALYSNKTMFATPEPSESEFLKDLTQLGTLINSNDGTPLMRETTLQQIDVVLGDLKQAQNYVNRVAQGDKIIILTSGFDCNNDRVETTEPPAKAMIRRITDGKSACSMKIFAESLEDADRFKVEVSDSLSNPVWVVLLDYASLNKMEVKDLTRGKEIFVRISGGNICGWGAPSEPMSFIPR